MSERIQIVVQVPPEFAAVIEHIAQAADQIEALGNLQQLEALTDAENQKISQAKPKPGGEKTLAPAGPASVP